MLSIPCIFVFKVYAWTSCKFFYKRNKWSWNDPQPGAIVNVAMLTSIIRIWSVLIGCVEVIIICLLCSFLNEFSGIIGKLNKCASVETRMRSARRGDPRNFDFFGIYERPQFRPCWLTRRKDIGRLGLGVLLSCNNIDIAQCMRHNIIDYSQWGDWMYDELLETVVHGQSDVFSIY